MVCLFFEESIGFLLISNAFLINDLFVVFITDLPLLLFSGYFFTTFA
jgi:hypothetical protein